MKRYLGITLIEVILVLVVASAIIAMSIRFYTYLKSDSDVMQVRANVDAIFVAMKDYYHVNCYGYQGSANKLVPGTLNPAASPPSIMPIDITSALITPKFLTETLMPTSIVNASGSGTNGYVAQFNEVTYTNSNGTVVSWQAQVSVQLAANKVSNATAYAGWMAAECLSNISGSTVTPCASSGNTGSFLVFQRTIANASREGSSTYWQMTPSLNTFRQMYSQPPSSSMSGATTQYFMCGN